ncbi:thioredoxin domain-containing protein [Nocardiopsis tropica]|uniref:DsbA family protein n=1 Tax=Nocardiopsis tropica TaxID=109330 RepID=UPI0031CF2D7A
MSDAPKQGAQPAGRSSGGGTAARGGASWKVPLAAGAALLLVTAAVAVVRFSEGPAEETGAAQEAGASGAPSGSAADGPGDAAPAGADAPMARRQADDPTALGDVDAPVVMVVYSDYHCPYCGRWVQETQPELAHYVESGDLRIEWRDFPVITDTSEDVARASRAAAEQGAFWEFHEAYYAAAEEPGESDTEETLAGVVDELGLDTGRFDEDRAADAAAAQVERDFSEGLSIGVTSTPAFLINGQAVMGAQPLEVFEAVIDSSLEAAGTGGGRQ